MSDPNPQEVLNERMNEAVAARNFDLAEQLSEEIDAGDDAWWRDTEANILKESAPKPAAAKTMAAELAGVEKRLAEIAASPETPTFTSVEERRTLEAKRGQLAARLPFAGRATEAVARGVGDEQVTYEAKMREAETWDRKSVTRARLEEEAFAALSASLKAKNELSRRESVENGRRFLAEEASRQAKAAATSEIRAQWRARLAELQGSRGDMGGGLLLGPDQDRPAQWMLDQAASEAKNAKPTAEQIAVHLKRIEGEQNAKFAWMGGA